MRASNPSGLKNGPRPRTGALSHCQAFPAKRFRPRISSQAFPAMSRVENRVACPGVGNARRAHAHKNANTFATRSWRRLALVWRAAEGLGYPFGPIICLMALTGQRRSEAGGATSDEIDLETRMWTIAATRSKNGLAHAVPLSPQAMAIIEALPRFVGGKDFLFSSWNTPPSGYSRAKRRLDEAMAKATDDEPIPPFALHDLGRTAVSGMARLGVDLPVIERVVNHISGSFASVVGVYQKHRYDDEKRATQNAWGAHVAALMKGSE
jgi:integrase